MDNLKINIPKNSRSPSPIKVQHEYQAAAVRKSIALHESEIDSQMKHWEEYKVKGIKIHRRSHHSSVSYGQW